MNITGELTTVLVSSVVCPNFGHPAQTSSLTKYKFFKLKIIGNNYELTVRFEIVSVFEWRVIIFVACLQHLHKPGTTKLGQSVDVSAYYPINIYLIILPHKDDIKSKNISI